MPARSARSPPRTSPGRCRSRCGQRSPPGWAGWPARPGAVHAELGTMTDARAAAQLADGPVAVMCEHGERAMTGASLLAAARCSTSGVSVLRGGPGDWAKAAGLGLEQE